MYKRAAFIFLFFIIFIGHFFQIAPQYFDLFMTSIIIPSKVLSAIVCNSKTFSRFSLSPEIIINGWKESEITEHLEKKIDWDPFSPKVN